MTTWNYRVVHQKFNDEFEEYRIHEVYYDENGEIKGCTVNEIAAHGDSLEDIKWHLDKMKEALEKPVLEWDQIGPSKMSLDK